MRRLISTLLLLSGVALADGRWYEYEGCRLIPNDGNDGDSFHVQTKSRHRIFRLYFVDTPETDPSLDDRIGEQAAYWGIERKDVLRLGHEAARFTEKFLDGEFTVRSKLEDARGRSAIERVYGIVNKGDAALATALVSNGLARVYGETTELPDGRDCTKYLADLRVLERKAKAAKLGVWGAGKAGSVFALPETGPRDVVVPAPVLVYSVDALPRYLGTLPRGTIVRVLGTQTYFNVRIRYTDTAGVEHEAQCARRGLGL